MKPLIITRDGSGRPRARPGRGDRSLRAAALADFLEADLGLSAGLARELLMRIAPSSGSPVSAWEGTTNAHAVEIRADRVRLHTLYSDPQRIHRYEPDDVAAALKVWLRLLDSPGPA